MSVLDYTSGATVNINSNITAPLAVAGTAVNTSQRNNVSANNAMAATPQTAAQQKAAQETPVQVKDADNGLIEASKLDAFVKGLGKTYDGMTKALTSAGDFMSVGASIGIGVGSGDGDGVVARRHAGTLPASKARVATRANCRPKQG